MYYEVPSPRFCKMQWIQQVALAAFNSKLSPSLGNEHSDAGALSRHDFDLAESIAIIDNRNQLRES